MSRQSMRTVIILGAACAWLLTAGGCSSHSDDGSGTNASPPSGTNAAGGKMSAGQSSTKVQAPPTPPP